LLLAQQQHQYPTDPSDPASEGDVGYGGILGGNYGQGLGAIVGGDMGMSVAAQGALGSRGGYTGEPGTGLGMAVNAGYAPGYGSVAEAAAMDVSATTAGLMSAISNSQAVNDAVDATGYNSDPGFSSDPGDPGDPGAPGSAFAGLSDPGGFSADPGGFDAGVGISADAGISGGFSGGVDAGGGISW
jgi:hypothetical protein